MSKKRILSGVLAVLMCLTVLAAFQMTPTMSAAAADPFTVQFNYNYTGAPTAPASFTKTTNADGKLDSLPVEQTLPLVGARPNYGFVGWYTNTMFLGEKVTLDTVFYGDANLYAKWEEVPSLYKEFEDYFKMGAFADYSTSSTQMQKHYNVNCPSNNFKLNSQINTTTMRNNFVAARTRILADATLSEVEKDAQLAKANEEVVLATSPAVITMLNNIRAWNTAHPDDKKYTRFHVVAWHGGQQPNQFFTNAFQYTNDTTSLARQQDLRNSGQDGAVASRETMKARLDNYIRQVVARYAPYKDIILSWDIINEPVDDFTGQIRNAVGDSRSQRGQWGLVWHDGHPARNADGSVKYTTVPDDQGIIWDQDRLFDESEWMRVAFESAAKWFKVNDCEQWALYVNDYMDSNKLYTKLQPTLDTLSFIRDTVDTQGVQIAYGLQGRLAWAYPTIATLRKQVEDAIKITGLVGVTEADIRSDFEPNPFYDNTKPPQAVSLMGVNPTPKWTTGDLNSGSGSFSNPTASTLTNTFDTHNSPVRRIPEWGTGNGMSAASASARYDGAANGFLPISEGVMKKQADFAADWMDILVDNSDHVEMYQWDGTSDSGTFNSSKGAHLWVTGISGRSGTFEKYSFFAAIGSPARNKLKKAIAANPATTDASKYTVIAPSAWGTYVAALNKATALLDKRIYTLEGVVDVKTATADLNAAAAALKTAAATALLIYDANNDTGAQNRESVFPAGSDATIKAASALGFTYAGYTFTGWNTAANGSGTAYTVGNILAVSENTTLFAQWKENPKECTVTFEPYDAGTGNSLTSSIAPVKVMSGNKIARPADPKKDGYYFAGWYTDVLLTNAWDFSTDIVEKNMRLYGKWTTVKFFYDGHEAKPGEINAGQTISFSAQTTAGVAQTMVVGLYNAKGQLVKTVAASGVVADGFNTFSGSLAIPAGDYTGAYFQVFVLNSATLVPVFPAITF